MLKMVSQSASIVIWLRLHAPSWLPLMSYLSFGLPPRLLIL
uniref:Uncharacterized protein n=1 Tax=Arundo donax TaxID=35708 RepID=A0A0A8ZJ47_ARUDO